MALELTGIILAIILATLAAIVYSLRVMVLLERRISRIDLNVERVAERILTEEARIERALNIKPLATRAKKSTGKKSSKKKASKKKSTKKKAKKRR